MNYKVDDMNKRHIQLQGSFETSYSLSLVNRKLIQAMDLMEKDDISIYATDGNGDYTPKNEHLKNIPHAAMLWKKSHKAPSPDITIRGMFPPRVNDVNGRLNFLAFGWEEDRIPQKYIDDFNRHLNGIGTMSQFVTDALLHSGIEVPVETMGLGVDLPINFEQLLPFPVKTNKQVKFLHISSAFPRKGVDILLDTYFSTFTASDDVCLILKTFPNVHNNVSEQLITLSSMYKTPPEVEFINHDFSDEDLFRLYKTADCYIHVARGEGFGLPVAEAMLAKIPVIVSPNSGLADFCNEDTALTVDYIIEKANTHLSNGAAHWATPNGQTLATLMHRFVYKRETLDIPKKVDKAHKLISTRFTWEAVAKRWYTFINKVEAIPSKPKLAMITTWNTRCGIAEYTKLLCNALQPHINITIYANNNAKRILRDEYYVEERLWNSINGDLQSLKNRLFQKFYDYIHMQFHPGLFNITNVCEFIQDSPYPVILTFHKTKEIPMLSRFASMLNRCYKLIVHQSSDADILIHAGIKKERLSLIPLGQVTYPDRSHSFIMEKLGINRRLIIGSYGFLFPHKGIKESIYATAQLKSKFPDVLYIIACALYDNAASRDCLEDCKKLVKQLSLESNVVFVNQFLPNDESIVLLQACNVLLMPYHPSTESASGAVRFCLAARRPVVVTRQPIFNEFEDCCYSIETCTPQEIADAVVYITSDTALQSTLAKNTNKQIEDTGWPKTAARYAALYNRTED